MPKPAKTPATTPFMERLPTPNRKALEAQWQATFGRPLSPKMRRPLAAQLLRFRRQEAAYGGLPAEVYAGRSWRALKLKASDCRLVHSDL